MLDKIFLALVQQYNTDIIMHRQLWNEIVKHYTHSNRYYHTLCHLENLWQQLLPIQNHIENWDAILFSLFYHDIIYKTTQRNNEQQSSILANQRMTQLGVPYHIIAKTQSQIIATQHPQLSTDSDTNYFTDADLSILGQNWDGYFEYLQNVRKEYQLYPDIIYNVGRKKVLGLFLDLPKIYKTPHFFALYETQARHNLQQELILLS